MDWKLKYEKLVEEVKKMRRLQNEYFRSPRSFAILKAAQKQEKRVDDIIEGQLDIFDK